MSLSAVVTPQTRWKVQWVLKPLLPLKEGTSTFFLDWSSYPSKAFWFLVMSTQDVGENLTPANTTGESHRHHACWGTH